MTDVNGVAQITSNTIFKFLFMSGEFVFTVTDVTKDGWLYDEAANGETSYSIKL